MRRRSKSARVTKRPSISFIGAGALASSMARSLHAQGCGIGEFVVRKPSAAARKLARELGAEISTLASCQLETEIIWMAVPDDATSECAQALAKRTDLKGKTVFHSSGALASDVLDVLRKQHAAVASIHPMMSFSKTNSSPDLGGVWFSIEGDAKAVRVARQIVAKLGGNALDLNAGDKALYHAFGAMIAPLLVSHLKAAEQMASRVGLDAKESRAVMKPIVEKVVAAFLEGGADRANSGPFLRGDVKTVERHLISLRGSDEEAVYRALAEYAIDHIKGENKDKLRTLLAKR